VENNIYYTIEKLKDEFEFHLASGIDFQVNPFEKDPSIKIIICKDLINKISPLKDLKALLFFYRLIKREKYDIVHTHETKASFITKLAAWLAGCKYIIYGLHGVTFNDPMNNLKRKFYIALEKYTIGVSDIIVSVSEDVMYHYHKNNIGKKIPYKVVRSGIELSDFFAKAQLTEEQKSQVKKALGLSSGDVVITNVGRFSFSKAQRYTIESFAVLKKEFPALKLVFIGEGELLEECKQLAKNLDVASSIVFAGYRENVAEILAITDLFMFTSLREGLPRVTVEASLMKVPIVAFEVEGIREVITNEHSGYIVKQYDVEALTFCARKLLTDTNLRKEFTQNSYNHVIKNWDSNLMAIQLREVYEKVV
ncbi:MAG TPA: glycosyltransferase, partial [Cytophagaceae bacterium]|nr:glycosyltransferase [Cytophagaceae bacterium]